MIPGEYDLTLYRGDFHSWEFVLWIDEAKTLPVDLTGAEARVQIRDKPKPKGVTVANLDVTITMPNVIFVQILSDMWDDPANIWPAKKGYWDLEVDWGSGNLRTFLAGAVAITPDITDVDI